ncbi:MAG: ABC transporter substrate-binding protein [Methanotrichaceae archaeon]|nr:ABC transporter substrate-binding protein [Methanotrichaceae archaeon]
MRKEIDMKNVKIFAFIVVMFILALSLLIAGAASLFAAEPRYGGILRESDQSDGVSIGYPPKLTSIYGNRQTAPAIETLFRIDKTGRPVPWLATGFTNNVATKALTLSLRKNVKFHDGTDFNAEAVKWNLDQSMSAKSPGAEKFKSIDVIDESTLRINLTEWDNTVTSYLSQALGMIISPAAFKKNGEDWCANHPVGTGPFQFVSWQKDVRCVYKKFDGYWQKGKPYLDRIEFAPILDSLTRQLCLRRGEIELGATIAAKDLASLEKDGYVVTRGRMGSGADTLIPDAANPKSPFADIRVRQAAQHAIDTKTLVKSIFLGEAESTNQWSYKGHWGYNPSVLGYPYNPPKAKQLLAEAGYPNGFKTKILYRTSPEQNLLFTAVQGYFKAVGIDAELDPAQIGRYNQTSQQGGKWEGLVQGGWWPYSDLAAGLATRFSAEGKYFTQYKLIPEDYDKAVKNAITAPDFETKQKWVQEAMKLMIDKYCLKIILYSPSAAVVSQPYLHNHGFFETPNSGLWTPEDAWLER